MTTQVQNGKAFEGAVANEISRQLGIPVLDSAEFQVTQKYLSEISDTKRQQFEKAATLAVVHIIELEKKNLEVIKIQHVWIAGDSLGKKGDVRDVIIQGMDGEVGLSCKTNHGAFKHSRLSGTNDFIKEWGLDESGCSDDYWNCVKPIFTELKEIRKASNRTALWRDVESVPERFYWPVLDAFESEVLRLTGLENPDAPEVTKRLVTYIIGNNDFYKVISRRKLVEINGFNLKGSLSFKKTRLPDHVIGIDRLNGGQFSKTIRFNHGFTFNFRIHSAESKVMPSLKFDVTATSLPPTEIYTNHIMFGD